MTYSTDNTDRAADQTTYHVQTPEQVSLQFAVAGIGTRGIALLLDCLVLAGCYGAIAGAVALLMGRGAFGGAGSYVLGFLIVAGFLGFWAYFVLLEYLWSGRTLGKRLLGIRAIAADGRPLSFFAAVVRNVLRIIDFLPAGWLLGMVAMMIDRAGRRVGDLAAGTVVVRDRPLTLPPPAAEPDMKPARAESVSVDDADGIRVTLPNRRAELVILDGLPAEWRWFLAEFERRRKGMAAPARRALVEQVWQAFAALPWVRVSGPDGEAWPVRDKERMLAAAAEALRRRAADSERRGDR